MNWKSVLALLASPLVLLGIIYAYALVESLMALAIVAWVIVSPILLAWFLISKIRKKSEAERRLARLKGLS